MQSLKVKQTLQFKYMFLSRHVHATQMKLQLSGGTSSQKILSLQTVFTSSMKAGTLFTKIVGVKENKNVRVIQNGNSSVQ